MKNHLLTSLWFLVSIFFSPVSAQAGIGTGYMDWCHARLNTGYWEQVGGPQELLGDETSSVQWVRKAADLDGVSDSLIAAFQNDPLMNWMTPKPTLQASLIRSFVRHTFFNGGILKTTQAGAGSALWFQNERSPTQPLGLVLTGQLFIVPLVGVFKMPQLLKFDADLFRARKEAIHSITPGSDGIYLHFMGVTPEWQRHGLGTALIKPILAHADATGQAVVLETQKLANVDYYQRFGFEVFKTTQVPANAPQSTVMVRAP